MLAIHWYEIAFFVLVFVAALWFFWRRALQSAGALNDAPSGRSGAEVPLDEDTRKRLDLLFAEPERGEAERLLVSGTVDLMPGDDPGGLARIRIASLKSSEGDMAKLGEAIEIARTDWRDLLMGTGFAEDPKAHLSWWPDKE